MTFTQTIIAGPYDSNSAAILSGKSMLPRGSACITGSGDLQKSGINAILQAATGSMRPFQSGFDEPTLDSIQASIENGFDLIKANGFQRMAVPFVGGGYFLTRIVGTKADLIDRIVLACLKKYAAEAVIVVYKDPTLHAAFENSVIKQFPALDPKTIVVDAGITSFHDHKAPVIMNGANMEVEFGDGVSGSIGKATGQIAAINAEAKGYIKAFWAGVLATPSA